MKRNAGFDRFDETMKTLITEPHSEIKAKLDAEKYAKQKRKTKKPSASDRASCEKI
jgi:hypothetical protein